MTADMIRSLFKPAHMQREDLASVQCEILQEMAAHMAEQNEYLRIIADTLAADGMAKHGQ